MLSVCVCVLAGHVTPPEWLQTVTCQKKQTGAIIPPALIDDAANSV